MSRLSIHLTFEELTNSDTHPELVAQNREEAMAFIIDLTNLCEKILEKIQTKYGPFRITSCFRGPELNKAVGGSAKSQHTLGQAADIVRSDWTWEALGPVCDWIAKESEIKFGQIIRSRRGSSVWLHVSYGTLREALDEDNGRFFARN